MAIKTKDPPTAAASRREAHFVWVTKLMPRGDAPTGTAPSNPDATLPKPSLVLAR